MDKEPPSKLEDKPLFTLYATLPDEPDIRTGRRIILEGYPHKKAFKEAPGLHIKPRGWVPKWISPNDMYVKDWPVFPHSTPNDMDVMDFRFKQGCNIAH